MTIPGVRRAAVGAVSGLALAAVLALSGVPVLASLRAVAAVAWIVLVPGFAIVRLARLDHHGLGGGAVAAVFGAAAVGPVYAVLTRAFAPHADPAFLLLAWPFPALLLLVGRRVAAAPADKPAEEQPTERLRLVAALAVLLAWWAATYLPAFSVAADGAMHLCLRAPFLNKVPALLHTTLLDSYGRTPQLDTPFASGQQFPFYHLHLYALMAAIERLSGAGPLLVEFRIYPLFAILLAFFAVHRALMLLYPSLKSGHFCALAVLLGNPLLSLLFGTVPQTQLAVATAVTGVALFSIGVSRGLVSAAAAGGAMFGSLLQIDLPWALVTLPGVTAGAFLALRQSSPCESAPGGPARPAGAFVVTAAVVAAAVSGAALLVTFPGRGPLPFVWGPGEFIADAFRQMLPAVRSAPAAVGVAVSGAVALQVLFVAAAVRGWRRVPQPARAVAAAVAACSLGLPLAVFFPVVPSMGSFLMSSGLLMVAILTPPALDSVQAGRPGIPAFVIPLAVAMVLPAAAALSVVGQCTADARLSAMNVRTLDAVRTAAPAGRPVAVLDRPAADLVLLGGVLRRPFSGIIADSDFLPSIEPVFRHSGIVGRARRVQELLRRLPGAKDAPEAAAALREIGAPVVELPHRGPLPAPLRGLLSPVGSVGNSVFCRVSDPGG